MLRTISELIDRFETEYTSFTDAFCFVHLEPSCAFLYNFCAFCHLWSIGYTQPSHVPNSITPTPLSL
jgi:hypothetical protein